MQRIWRVTPYSPLFSECLNDILVTLGDFPAEEDTLDNDNDNDNDTHILQKRSSHEDQPRPTDANGEVVTSSKTLSQICRILRVNTGSVVNACESTSGYSHIEKITGEMSSDVRFADACHSLHKIFS